MSKKSLLSILTFVPVILAHPVDQQKSEVNSHFGLEFDYKYSAFSYYDNDKPTYANSNPAPTATTFYALHYSDLSQYADNQTTTTWGTWFPNATNTATDSADPYGEWAFNQVWDAVSIQNFSTGLYSTTVEPTAVPTESLVLPPPDVFQFESDLKFPENFIFGVAGSAAQIEGAISVGRTPSVLESNPGWNAPATNYVTNENYYLYKQDLKRLAAMGVKYYSFTISWNRILPFVLPGTPVNQEAIDHYDDLINTCIEFGITPIVTLNHFDTPSIFVTNSSANVLSGVGYHNGGYDNDTFVDAFVNYGKIILTHYADRVPYFVTINEPNIVAGTPKAVKNVIQSTAQLHDFYHKVIGGQGKVGIKFAYTFGVPFNTSSSEDVTAVNRYSEFNIAAYANPLFLGSDQPDSWKKTFSNFTEALFTAEELAAVAKKCDFLGIDPYTSNEMTAPEGGIEECQVDPSNPYWPACYQVSATRSDGWAVGYRSQSYVYITPIQLREALNYLWNTYKAPVFLTEFGFPEWREEEKELKDQQYDLGRSVYYRSFLDAVLKSIHNDNCEIIGALAWSFMDNWEFGDYGQQFGLQVVNRTTQERYFKKSFFDIIQYVDERRI